MANTPSFNWETPDDTDLVKDGAAAIRTLGNAIDSSMTDLKGGTTGQVLSKASNTDMDFTWVAQDDSNAIQNALLTTTGDTIYASSASTPARLGIGSSGQVLTVSGGVPTWASPAGASLTLSSIASGNLTSGTSLNLSSLSSYDTLILHLRGITWGTNTSRPIVKVNASGSAVYKYNASINYANVGDRDYGTAGTSINLGAGVAQSNTSTANYYILKLTNCKNAGMTDYHFISNYYSGSSDINTWGMGVFTTAAAVSSLEVSTLNAYTFNGSGTYELYGA